MSLFAKLEADFVFSSFTSRSATYLPDVFSDLKIGVPLMPSFGGTCNDASVQTRSVVYKMIFGL